MLLAATLGDVDWFVSRKKEDVVVMGHTHEAMLKSLKRSDRKYGKTKIIYANSGAWVDSVTKTYIDILYENPTSAHPTRVQLKQYPNVVLKEQTVPVSSSSSSSQDHSIPVSVPTWTCDPTYFNASDGCDCACGTWDPDCDLAPQFSIDYNETEPVYLFNCGIERPGMLCVRSSSGTSKCLENTTVPIGFTCAAASYNSLDGCDCECGAWDPDCDQFEDILNCNEQPGTTSYCDFNNGTGAGECTYDIDFQVPPTWTCEPTFWNASDGCDCECGSLDPDCSTDPANRCDCHGAAQCTESGDCDCLPSSASESSFLAFAGFACMFCFWFSV